MTTQVGTQKNPAIRASLDRVRNRINQLEKIAGQMKDSSDQAIKDAHAGVVGIVADLRTETSALQEQFGNE